jgi:sugar phosphate isomerase/epimerase
MRFGNAAWGFRETPLEQQLAITNRMGLSVLEIGIANAPNDLRLDISDSEIQRVKGLFKRYNVSLLCAAIGNDFTNGNRDDMQKIKKAVELCEKLGVAYLRIFAGFSPVSEVTGKLWDIMIECLTEVGEYAKTKNIIPVIETHGGVKAYEDGVEHFYSTSSEPQALLRMLKELPNSLMVNFDPANLYAVGIRHPEAIYEQIKDRVACIHLKDFVRLPSGHLKPAACGASDMDWRALMKAIRGFEGPVLFEYENTSDVEDGCKRCLEYINKVLEEISK